MLDKKNTLTYCCNIENRAHHRHQQNGAQIVEEHAIGHKVASIQNNGWQHVQEECIRRQWRDINACAEQQNNTDYYTNHNQQTRLGENAIQLRRLMEPDLCNARRQDPNADYQWILHTLEFDLDDRVVVHSVHSGAWRWNTRFGMHTGWKCISNHRWLIH